MKSKFLFALVALSLAACQSTPRKEAPSATAIGPDLEFRVILPGVFIVNHLKPWPANSMVVEVSPSELLIVDSPYTPDATSLMMEWVRTKFGKRKITAINTHSHADRVGGNEVYLKKNIPVHGSDLTKRLLLERRDAMRADLVSSVTDPALKAAFAKARFSEPNHVFPLNAGLELTFSDERAVVFYPGHGHTQDNVVVYLPKRKLLFGGCFIVGMPKLGFIAQADLKTWPDALAKLTRFDIEWVVPGHGNDFSPSLIAHTEKLVKDAAKP